MAKSPTEGAKRLSNRTKAARIPRIPKALSGIIIVELLIAFFYEFEYYIKHEVNDKAKYLNLLVLLTFLVGHVQYAYASYFCTMKQAPVQSPAMTMTPPSNQTEDACTQCSDVIPPREGPQFVEGNCIKIVTAEKSVVSSFTDSVKLLNHFVTAYSFVPVLNYQPSAINYQLFTHSNSPPLDLPILISNLRI